jgi:thioesterase domain-containing protein
VHAHGGNVLNFKDLARHLGADRPFYGLQAQGLDAGQPRHSRIEEMAAHYLREIKTVQPEGPYFIGGHCFGGKVAFEMAYQLRAQGEQVAMLAVIDAFAPGYPPLLPWIERGIKQRFAFHWSNLKSLSPEQRWNYVLDKTRIAGLKIERLAKKVLSKSCLAMGVSLPPSLRTAQEPKPVRFNYERKVYPGKMLVFAPTIGPRAYYFEPHMGWEGMAAEGLEIHRVPGRIAQIISDPSAKPLAEQLAACFDRALADSHQTCREPQVLQPAPSPA